MSQGEIELEQIRDFSVLKEAAKLVCRENERLREEIATLKSSLQAEGSEAEAQQLQMKLETLGHQLAARNRMLFGDRREHGRGEEADKQAEEGRSAGTGDKKPQKGHGSTVQLSLEHIEVQHLLDEADQVCTSCGGELEVWEGQHQQSEEVSVVAHKFVVLKHQKQKYRCRCGGCVQTAPGPYKLNPGGRYADAFAIQVAVDKYQDHLPLHRQAMRCKRMGLQVRSQTLWDQIQGLATALEPAYHRLGEHLRKASVLFVDETPWRLLQKGKSKKWQVWSMSHAHGVYYHIDPSRSAQAARTLLGDFKGVVMCDGFSAYKTLARTETEPIDPRDPQGQGQVPVKKYKLAHCWAHVRRKFFELQNIDPQVSTYAMGLIRALYKADKQLRDGQHEHPQDKTLPWGKDPRAAILEELKDWAIKKLCASPNSPTATARDYMLKHWQGLTLHLKEPEVPLDNNRAERALRKVVIGRKNPYGSKSLRGTQVAAQLYSLIESAHQQGLDPTKYLTQAVEAYHLNDPIPLPHQVA